MSTNWGSLFRDVGVVWAIIGWFLVPFAVLTAITGHTSLANDLFVWIICIFVGSFVYFVIGSILKELDEKKRRTKK